MTLRPEDLSPEAASAFRVWTKVFNLSEGAALAAVAPDGLVDVPEVDGLAGSLGRIFSLSEGAAAVAAQGRGSGEFSPVVGDSDSSERRLRLAQEALDSTSDAECDAFLEEQRRRKSAKAAPVKKGLL